MATELQTRVRTDGPPIVFVSYSHLDETWKDKLLPQLKQLEKLGDLQVWNDRQIKAGTDWYAEIKHVLHRTKVAVCLISANFLNSSFCMDEEVSYLLQRRNQGGLEIIPILVESCTWKPHRWLKRLQMFPRDGKNVTTHFNSDPAFVFSMVSDQVYEMLQPDYVFERPPPPGTPPEKLDINRLPKSDDLLFGRRETLNELDRIWEQNKLNIIVYKASGGVGKSSLVRCWVEDMALDNYRDARRIFAWSFYSQGTNERVTSADEFLSEALEWFGDETRGEGLSAWDRGQRLAELVRQQRTLLLLDGLEPLQSGQAFDRGKVKDPGLETLLYELAKDNPGLCLITTREEITDLWDDEDDVSVGQFDLDKISAIAGRALLRVSGIAGKDDELEQAVHDFGQHAYAIKLLGSFLKQEGEPHIRRAAEIPDLADIDEKDGKHPRRVMATFAERFGQSPKANILAMLGLFDRPADAGCIDALRAAPSVTGLNDAVYDLSKQQWQDHIADLRLLGLLTPKGHHTEDELDAHPLVREHFGAALRDEHPDAWRAGHLRLYAHLRDIPQQDQPDTLDEMIPLYRAITHACEAKEFLFAISIYIYRIHRSPDFYGWRQLGSYSMDLAALASFFDKSSNDMVNDAPASLTPMVLSPIGLCTCSIGYPAAAVPIFRNAWIHVTEPKPHHDAAAIIINLSEALLGIGNLQDVKIAAEESYALANRYHQDFLLIVSCSTLANVEHQMGNDNVSLILFEEAEELQRKHRPEIPTLYSLRGYYHFELLLSIGQFDKSEGKAGLLLEVSQTRSTLGKLDLALRHLACGRIAAALGNFQRANKAFDQSIDNFRMSRDIMRLPIGLLARAAYIRESSLTNYDKALVDLDEAMRIAKRGEMRLHQCDAHLEYARLALAEGQLDDARVHLKSATSLVSECGYHRRDGEVAALEAALA